jgi:hypothetical protein
MKVFWVKDGLPEGNISDEDMRNFQETSDMFVGAVRVGRSGAHALGAGWDGARAPRVG